MSQFIDGMKSQCSNTRTRLRGPALPHIIEDDENIGMFRSPENRSINFSLSLGWQPENDHLEEHPKAGRYAIWNIPKLHGNGTNEFDFTEIFRAKVLLSGDEVGFSGMILWWIRICNEFEVNGNSLERVQQYTVIEQEPKPSADGIPPAYWPASGSLRVEKLSSRYSADGPRVLHEISFEVKSGERVGIGEQFLSSTLTAN